MDAKTPLNVVLPLEHSLLIETFQELCVSPLRDISDEQFVLDEQ